MNISSIRTRTGEAASAVGAWVGRRGKLSMAAIIAGGLAVGGIGFGAAANAAGADINSARVINKSLNTIDMDQATHNLYTNTKPKAGEVTETALDPALKAKVNTIGTGAQGPTGPMGPQGPAGPAGNDGILSVTAASSLVDRPDSGLHGTWAKDNMSRTVAITRQKAVKSTNCGSGATKCWFYTGSIVDNGTFATVAGGKSPQAGADIAGTVNGTVNGASQIEFYASSDAPNPALVDVTVTGAAHPTAEWVKMFFAAGTVVTTTDLLDWSWTYTAPGTCEKWVNAKAGNTGDITGVNAC